MTNPKTPTPKQTPRTDRQSCRAQITNNPGYVSYEMVDADFARQLEREVATLKAELTAEREAHKTAEQLAEDAEKACAEMRDTGNAYVERDKLVHKGVAESIELIGLLRAWKESLNSTIGRDYVHKSKLDEAITQRDQFSRQLTEANRMITLLQTELEEARRNDN